MKKKRRKKTYVEKRKEEEEGSCGRERLGNASDVGRNGELDHIVNKLTSSSLE